MARRFLSHVCHSQLIHLARGLPQNCFHSTYFVLFVKISILLLVAHTLLLATIMSKRNNVVSDDDVVIVSALRTPMCRSRKGALKDVLPSTLFQTVLEAIIDQTQNQTPIY